MPANIPSPVVGAGGGGGQNPGQALLLAIAQQIMGGLVRTGFNKFAPEPQAPLSPQQEAVRGEQEAASASLANRPGSMEQQSLHAMAGMGLGNANVPTKQLAGGLRSREALKASAPQRATEAAAEDKITLRAQAVAAARQSLRQVGGDNAPILEKLFDFSANAAAAGIDSSTINSIIRPSLPPDAATELSMQETRLKIIDAKNLQDADTFATGELVRQGILPAEVKIVPGAAKTLLTVLEGREGKKVDWQQEAVDFITGRVGESAGGTGGMSIVDGQLSSTPPVTVEQAMAEWREVVTRLAPAAERDRLLSAIDSNAFQRRVTIGLVTDEVAKIFMAGGSDDLARKNLAGSFTPEVINSIISNARKTAPGLKP